ncbi:hypothetical protein D9758_015349 [Tetrapyrgos nigripes]|uniref:Uncharacterized protein n=1 Tax=Tetrapyrgos nigripes TaxID=182062 RepID=A0A8H5CN86_9AGAR|nr:hypothetical protein D9758_015349 [Tetrapyrgos nigripes]
MDSFISTLLSQTCNFIYRDLDMPRKCSKSVIAKANRSPEEEASCQRAKSIRREVPEKARERMAKHRANMSEDKAAAKEKRKEYDSKYYLRAFIDKHGEYAFMTIILTEMLV